MAGNKKTEPLPNWEELKSALLALDAKIRSGEGKECYMFHFGVDSLRRGHGEYHMFRSDLLR
jgi:hypothetical protein